MYNKLLRNTYVCIYVFINKNLTFTSNMGLKTINIKIQIQFLKVQNTSFHHKKKIHKNKKKRMFIYEIQDNNK